MKQRNQARHIWWRGQDSNLSEFTNRSVTLQQQDPIRITTTPLHRNGMRILSFHINRTLLIQILNTMTTLKLCMGVCTPFSILDGIRVYGISPSKSCSPALLDLASSFSDPSTAITKYVQLWSGSPTPLVLDQVVVGGITSSSLHS